MDGTKVRCKSCQKSYYEFGKSGIFRHVKTSKSCHPSYTDEEIKELQNTSRQLSAAARNSKLKEQNKRNKPQR